MQQTPAQPLTRELPVFTFNTPTATRRAIDSPATFVFEKPPIPSNQAAPAAAWIKFTLVSDISFEHETHASIYACHASHRATTRHSTDHCHRIAASHIITTPNANDMVWFGSKSRAAAASSTTAPATRLASPSSLVMLAVDESMFAAPATHMASVQCNNHAL
jgi:hypothetical protein